MNKEISAPRTVPEGACDSTVFDTFSDTVDADLRTSIDRFTDQGVDVRVLILGTTGIDGMKDMSDADFYAAGNSYVDRTLDTCGINQDNLLTFVFVDDSGYATIVTSGIQDRFRSRNESDIKEVTDVFLDELAVGGSETFQDDVSVALNKLYEAEFGVEVQAPPQNNTNKPQAETEAKPSDNIDIPVLPLIAGSGAIALATAISMLGRNKMNIKKLNAGFDEVFDRQAKRATAAFTIEETDASSPLNTVRPDDIPELVELNEQISEGYDNWIEMQAKYKLAVQDASKGFRPNRAELEEIINQYKNEASEYQTLIDQFNEEIERIARRQEEINEVFTNVDAEIKNVDLLCIKLGDSSQDAGVKTGYNLGSLIMRLAEIRERNAKAQTMNKVENLINEPYQTTSQNLEQLAEIKAQLESLPDMHSHIIEDSQTLQGNLALNESSLTNMAEIEETIRDKYHESCMVDVPSAIVNARKLHAKLQKAIKSIGEPKDVFDFDKLIDLERQIGNAQTLVDNFKQLNELVTDHLENLDSIRSKLGGSVDALDVFLDDTAEYIDEYADYIEDATEHELVNLVPEVDKLREQLAMPKPPYLQLDKEFTRIKSSVEKWTKQAKTEHQEIVDLEAENARIKKLFHDELSDLESYGRTQTDVDTQTENDIENLNFPEEQHTRNRELIRNVNITYKNALEQLRSVREDAQDDVQREQRKRQEIEQARQAKIRAEQLERRAEQRRKEERTERSRSSARLSSATSYSSGRVGGGSSSHSSGRVNR